MDLGGDNWCTIKVEDNIFGGDPGHLLSIRVEINEKEPLPLVIEIGDKSRYDVVSQIKIKNLRIYCLNCGRIGHGIFKCFLGLVFNPEVVDNIRK